MLSRLEEKTNIFHYKIEFQNGTFEVQDAGSQLIAPYLRVQPGDACGQMLVLVLEEKHCVQLL